MINVFIELCDISIAAGWLVLAVLLLRFFLHKLPKKTFPLLWGLVGLRLLLPTLPHSKFAVMPAEITQPSLISADLGLNFQPAGHTSFTTASPVSSLMTGKESAEAVASIQTIQLLALVWVIGVIVLFLYGMIQTMRLQLHLRTAIRLDKGVYQSDTISYPFVFGVLKPRIYLPFSLDPEVVPYVLAHETSHIIRRDYLWKPLGYVLLCVYWFHPLLWGAYFYFCRDLEYACDEKVIAEYKPAQRLHYSEALLSVSAGNGRFKVCPVAFGKENVKQRIHAILYYKKPAVGAMLLCVVMVVGLCGCFFTQKYADETPVLSPPESTVPVKASLPVLDEGPTDLHTAAAAAVVGLCEQESVAPYRAVNYKLLRVEKDSQTGRITGYAEVLDSTYLMQNGEAIPENEQGGMAVFHLQQQEDNLYIVQDATWLSQDDMQVVQDGSHMEELQQQNAAQAMLYAQIYQEDDNPKADAAVNTILTMPIARGSSENHVAMDFIVQGANEVPVPVPAIAAGKVVKAYRGPGKYGNYVVVHHGDNLYSLYAHLAEVSVESSQMIAENQVLGIVGMTGWSSSFNLHLEIHKGDYNDPKTCVNPSDYLIHLS